MMATFKKLLLAGTFFRSFGAVSLLSTLLCGWIIWRFGAENMGLLALFKLLVFALSLFAVSTGWKKKYYYYYNLGISRYFLWVSVFAGDFILFLSVMGIISSLR